jgi:hypothetical protein
LLCLFSRDAVLGIVPFAEDTSLNLIFKGTWIKKFFLDDHCPYCDLARDLPLIIKDNKGFIDPHQSHLHHVLHRLMLRSVKVLASFEDLLISGIFKHEDG